MIVKIAGRLVQKKDHSVVLEVNGISYEILVPHSVRGRLDEKIDGQGQLELIVYQYWQLTPSSAFPVLVGFLNEIERDFFLQFIQVSGIGPRAAVKALNRPISEISRAIDENDFAFLKSLPGIGMQKAKEIVAKLQGKVAKFGLIQDQSAPVPVLAAAPAPVWQEEALEILLQLQYKKQEAKEMIGKALARCGSITTTEDLLNEIYKQRTTR